MYGVGYQRFIVLGKDAETISNVFKNAKKVFILL